MNEIEENELNNIIPFTRILTDDLPQLPYRKKGNLTSTVLHWGQRKLLLMEMEFLTLYGDRSSNVLYIGAADGKHILYLSKLFPKHHFTLYDTNKFDEGLYNIDNITVKEQYFTDSIAETYDSNILMISDIRNVPPEFNKNKQTGELTEELEENVKIDMEMQQNWYLKIKPKAALLKFRLPYSPGVTSYLTGEIRLQPWAPSTSTETRITVLPETSFNDQDEPIFTEYINEKYESILYRFNKCTRIQPISINIYVGIVRSYDLMAEVDIIEKYLTSIASDKKVIDIIEEIDTHLGKTHSIKYSAKIALQKRQQTPPAYSSPRHVNKNDYYRSNPRLPPTRVESTRVESTWESPNIEADSW